MCSTRYRFGRQHSVTAYDAVAGGRTGLPCGPMSTPRARSRYYRRCAAARAAQRRGDRPARPVIGVVLPVPGDVRGLPAGTGFQRDALNAGEAVIVSSPPGEAIGLVPEFEYDEGDDGMADEDLSPELCRLSWTVYSVPSVPIADQMDLGRPNTRCVRRCGRRPRRWARCGWARPAVWTIRAGSSSRCWSRADTIAPRSHARPGPSGAGERRSRRRDHRGQRRPDADRDAERIGGPDRQ